MICSGWRRWHHAAAGTETLFDLILPLSGDPTPENEDRRSDCAAMRTYKLVCGPDDQGAPSITIMQSGED